MTSKDTASKHLMLKAKPRKGRYTQTGYKKDIKNFKTPIGSIINYRLSENPKSQLDYINQDQ